MDLSGLSDQDFTALQRGDLKAMSDAGFAQLIKAQEAAMPMSDKQARTRAQMAEQVNPINGMSTLDILSTAAGKGVSNIGTALAQAIPWSGVDRASVDEMKRRDAPLMSTLPGKVGFVLGSGAAGAPLMLAPGANTLVGASLYGAGLGAATPVGEGDNVVKNALWGGLGGAAGKALSFLGSRALKPDVSPKAQTLIDSGITLTPGQRLGGGFKRAEDALTSMPIVGDMIRTQQRRTFQEFNAAVANKALSNVGDTLPSGLVGREAVDYTEKAIGRAYESALSQIKSVQADQPFAAELKSLGQMVKQSPMPGEVKDQFARVIKNQITGKLQGQNAMTAQTFKDAESEIGKLATKYASDPSVDKQLLGDALQKAQASLRRLLERSAGPDLAGDVKAANAGWAEFKRMQRAASMLGAKDGVFSPENYLNAVKALDRSKDKGAFARGSALGQKYGESATNVMGATVPDSGTPFRTLMNEPIKGGISALLGVPTVGAPYAGVKVQRAVQTALSGKRPALATKAAAELEMAAPLLSLLGINVGNAAQRLP